MTTTTNIQMNANTGMKNERGNDMKRSMFLAPQFSKQTIMMIVFGYLAMVTVVLIMTANPFQSTASLDFGPESVAASAHIVAVEIPVVQIPAAPYLIVEPAN